MGDQWEALIIDDYFAIGAEPLGDNRLNSFAAKALATARKIYEIEGVIGSTEKDVEAAPRFKAAGAEVNSDVDVVRNGAITVAAPAAKRFALAALSLRAARLTLASRLAGNWVSVLLYRKCLSCAVSGFFSLTAGLSRVQQTRLHLLGVRLRMSWCPWPVWPPLWLQMLPCQPQVDFMLLMPPLDLEQL